MLFGVLIIFHLQHPTKHISTPSSQNQNHSTLKQLVLTTTTATSPSQTLRNVVLLKMAKCNYWTAYSPVYAGSFTERYTTVSTPVFPEGTTKIILRIPRKSYL